jgi:hypothetical protein
MGTAMSVLSVCLFAALGFAIWVKAIQIKNQVNREEADKKIEEMIRDKTFPSFTPEEQALFLIGQDSGNALSKIGTTYLNSRYFKFVFKLDLPQAIMAMSQPQVFETMKLKNRHDGIWISKWENEYELVFQDKGKTEPYKKFKSIQEMLTFLAKMHMQERFGVTYVVPSA